MTIPGLGAKRTVRRALTLLCFLGTLLANQAPAASLTTEATVALGGSTDGSRAGALVLRAFGDLDTHWRYFLEGALASRSGAKYGPFPVYTSGTAAADSFSAAYPYSGRPAALETYVARSFQAGNLAGEVKLGRYRAPFGIYSEGDQGYMGFLRSPLVRYYAYYGVSNFWLEGGASVAIGTPQAQLEASLGMPQEDIERRRSGLDEVVRLQGYQGNFIAGISHISTRPMSDLIFSTGTTSFDGIDLRWMQGPIQIRGEMILGKPASTSYTRGWYVDTMLHTPTMERLNWVLRLEEIHYSAGVFSFSAHRATAGARITLTPLLSASVNVIHQPHLTGSGSQALDIGLNYSIRH